MPAAPPAVESLFSRLLGLEKSIYIPIRLVAADVDFLTSVPLPFLALGILSVVVDWNGTCSCWCFWCFEAGPKEDIIYSIKLHRSCTCDYEDCKARNIHAEKKAKKRGQKKRKAGEHVAGRRECL